VKKNVPEVRGGRETEAVADQKQCKLKKLNENCCRNDANMEFYHKSIIIFLTHFLKSSFCCPKTNDKISCSPSGQTPGLYTKENEVILQIVS
jgi:hypothetical protein